MSQSSFKDQANAFLLVVVAVFQDLRNLLGGTWLQYQLGLAAVLLHPVVVECLEIALVLSQCRGCQDGFEVGKIVIRELLPERHPERLGLNH